MYFSIDEKEKEKIRLVLKEISEGKVNELSIVNFNKK